ncbi:MAG TPA: histidine kinase [Streptosporangiaceae bacterium]|nr:histidine kinase [Streptosporangiaceae bacterium]
MEPWQVRGVQAGTASPPWFARMASRLSGWLADRAIPDAGDYAIAAGCFAAFTLPVLFGVVHGASSPPAVAAFGLAAAAPLVVRRKWPVVSVAAVTAVYVAAALAGVGFTPWISNAGPNLAIAVFTAADRCDRRSSLLAAIAAGLATWAALPLGIHLHPGRDQDAVQAIAVIVAWVSGDIVRARRGYRQSLELEARRRAEDKEGRARAEERLRLSRDVHDVVSHSLAIIAVRSGVARVLIDQQPDEARAALSAIETASRSALDELRQLLRRIREPASGPANAAPALADLPALAAQLREGGLDLTYRRTGQPRAVSPALELSAYRIAQEALTNVVKHAPGASAQIEVTYRDDGLVITVTDDGPGRPDPPPQSAGLGITGMRERAEMFGGQLTARSRPEGGFAVIARLPAGYHR